MVTSVVLALSVIAFTTSAETEVLTPDFFSVPFVSTDASDVLLPFASVVTFKLAFVSAGRSLMTVVSVLLPSGLVTVVVSFLTVSVVLVELLPPLEEVSFFKITVPPSTAFGIVISTFPSVLTVYVFPEYRSVIVLPAASLTGIEIV